MRNLSRLKTSNLDEFFEDSLLIETLTSTKEKLKLCIKQEKSDFVSFWRMIFNLL